MSATETGVGLKAPFDYPNEKTFCGRCGAECQALGHLMSEFLMCPTHGEFTVAPVVIREPLTIIGPEPDFSLIDNPSPDAGKWFICFRDETEMSMWETCRYVDSQGLSGRATRTGP